ncbi:MAG: hypothetical protein JWP95_2074 [Actinotalea sp.]|nr:hypothetical protein [Actinotalea sp.]
MTAEGEPRTSGSPEDDALQHVLDLAQRVAPGAVAGISYGARALRVDGRPLIAVSAGRSHLSLFPFSPEAIDAVRDELAGFSLSRGTVRFTADRPVPDDVVERLVRHRLQELAGPGQPSSGG